MKTWHYIIIMFAIGALIFGFRKPIQRIMTRGYINKNPGNIRLTPEFWKGEIKGNDKAFKTFTSMPYGYRAIFVLLRTYINMGKNSIRNIISTYAPSSENNTTAYITMVAKKTNLDPDEKIYLHEEDKIKKIVAAISYVENGVTADMNEVENGYILFKTA